MKKLHISKKIDRILKLMGKVVTASDNAPVFRGVEYGYNMTAGETRSTSDIPDYSNASNSFKALSLLEEEKSEFRFDCDPDEWGLVELCRILKLKKEVV